MKKYEFTEETKGFLGRTLHRIRAVSDFGDVHTGDLGGWVESESNLSHTGDAWVYSDARVYGDAWVSGNAWVCGNAWVSGNAIIKSTIHYMTIGPIGSRNDFVTFTRDKSGEIFASVGCFYGNIAEFRAKVKETHGESRHAKTYLMAADLAEAQIDTTPIEG